MISPCNLIPTNLTICPSNFLLHRTKYGLGMEKG